MVNVLFFCKASVDIIVYDWFMNNKLKTLIMDAAITNKQHMGDQGWRSSESAHLRRHQCVPGFDSQTKSHMWVEFVVGSLLCSERFFSGTPVLPSPQTDQHLTNSNSSLEKCPQLALGR